MRRPDPYVSFCSILVADDTQIYHSIPSESGEAQKQLDQRMENNNRLDEGQCTETESLQDGCSVGGYMTYHTYRTPLYIFGNPLSNLNTYLCCFSKLMKQCQKKKKDISVVQSKMEDNISFQ